MIEPNAMLNPDERIQFVEAFHENLDLVLEILEAMRCESTNAADSTAAQFLGGMHQALYAFGVLRGAPQNQPPTYLRAVWPEPSNEIRL